MDTFDNTGWLVRTNWFIFFPLLQEDLQMKQRRLRRSHSEAEIKHAVNKAASDPDLIGDCSRVIIFFSEKEISF